LYQHRILTQAAAGVVEVVTVEPPIVQALQQIHEDICNIKTDLKKAMNLTQGDDTLMHF
jgi:hypothetical protein